MFFEMSPEGY